MNGQTLESATGDRAAMFGGSMVARSWTGRPQESATVGRAATSSKGLGPENYGVQEGEADSQGSGHAVRRLRIDFRHGCIEGRMNVLLSIPLVRAVSLA
jgi:hypothetical protein